MKRVSVFKDKNEEIGVLMAVQDTTDQFEFKREIADRLNLSIADVNLFTSSGCQVFDLRVIRDDEKIYLTPKANKDVRKLINNLTIDPEKCTATQTNSVLDWITINVGGKHFTTTRATLLAKEPSSMLARMFAGDNVYLMNPSATDSSGAYLIDRCPEYFEPILNYLRHGSVILDKHVNPRGVLEEAVFYGIDSMIPHLKQLIENSENKVSDHDALTRQDVIRSLIITPTACELRFQGVNLAGADLSKLDLRNINFKYACLSRCNLSGANLSFCCLERADLSYANLEGTQLLGVKALCANMEGVNLQGCFMEDPAGLHAIMEGVNLKGANLEGSNLAGVNLRVATLKNANLQNCDLRAAVLAGANLENCDLSGSDLHEANLRGANLKDAAFELMLTPLHMSQTIR
ncbi:hypothetical protein EVAR_24610_1 [Eumeta japonica]|uniref:BTB domain-containing protein n=1 Tax=Eumeta variegata TaxID=151549 RepID=A0A4C1V2A1_EUMVA|nr:hypothetical protein EVAR_24610_1 [Eumeta japonica]